MLEEKKTVELKDEELERVAGGRGRVIYTINAGIYHIVANEYFQVTSQQRGPGGSPISGIPLRLGEDGKLHKEGITTTTVAIGTLCKCATANNLEIVG